MGNAAGFHTCHQSVAAQFRSSKSPIHPGRSPLCAWTYITFSVFHENVNPPSTDTDLKVLSSNFKPTSIDKMIACHHNNTLNKTTTVSKSSLCSNQNLRVSSTRRRLAARPILERLTKQSKLLKTPRVPLATTIVNGVSQTSSLSLSQHRHLRRPAFREINVKSLEEICPEFKGVAPQYVRDTFSTFAAAMFIGLQGTRVEAALNTAIPNKELEVVYTTPISIPTISPSHIFAVNAASSSKFVLYPVHGAVFTANCANLPSLPKSSYPLDASTGRTTLPVVTFTIPSVEAFPLLQTSLYLLNQAEALQELFLPANIPQNFTSLRDRAQLIHGVYANACAFGVVESKLYDIIEKSWIAALNAISRLPPPPPSSSVTSS
ncbi:hypothetical protein B0H34DRAFT_507862 [Crassisporium funariophilum]|nr:hypothetical protein B0H34DRAFT_507862 [Crassisporium funariophilum]